MLQIGMFVVLSILTCSIIFDIFQQLIGLSLGLDLVLIVLDTRPLINVHCIRLCSEHDSIFVHIFDFENLTSLMDIL